MKASISIQINNGFIRSFTSWCLFSLPGHRTMTDAMIGAKFCNWLIIAFREVGSQQKGNAVSGTLLLQSKARKYERFFWSISHLNF